MREVRGGAKRGRVRKKGRGERRTLSSSRFVRGAAARGRGRRKEEGESEREKQCDCSQEEHRHTERVEEIQREKRRFPFFTSLIHERSHAGAHSRSRSS
ncbi:hypothetical protein JOB18_029122 [Solea senegalensis]|uniref:Uncharacterized protein n=1 Tax=Solea senegalensis TaxID=28829 RepID=A0AAV6RMX0_SOLSE|nr:hypothetical protein JOB18_029122 [Solea senegalensis]